ncbi:hypothetical protein ACQP00_18340 [Dactylosporangium sp. CS-047395]|uniref:hypothetical protein n=1 Tax=Dactylosporangium sp. CS-047395 TaxID=3239936 RepID=UPI003D8D445E
MHERSTARGVRAVALTAAALAFAAACSDSSDPQAGTSTAPTAPATTPAAPSSTPTTSGPSAAPSYTKPPSRSLTRPAGVAAIPGSACSTALSDIHIFAASWAANQVKYVARGQQVPDDVWAETAQVTDNYHQGIGITRGDIKAAKVPESFPVYGDLADADAAITEAVAAAKAKDSSNVMSIYFKARTAEDHLVESCSALE